MAGNEHDTPGEPPAIRDEAADSPMWLPALGLALLLLGVVFIAWRSSSVEVPVDEATTVHPVDDAQPEAAEPPEVQAEE